MTRSKTGGGVAGSAPSSALSRAIKRLGKRYAAESAIPPLKPGERRPPGFYLIDHYFGGRVSRKTVEKID